MEEGRWRQIADLYDAASELEPARRGEFLAEAAHGNDDLRLEVESLLKQDVTRDGVLERAAQQADLLLSSAAFQMPAAIARYRILSRIGEGGMGVVYEAEQDHPRRKVAVKVLITGSHTPEMLRRFERESEALGRLQHPGIAQIYEAGVSESEFGPQPYLAMEFIRGETLERFAVSHHLDVAQRVAMMIKVCEGVQHAHQRGIIHRDLKPSNILVDETGQPKILDFGVARFTAQEMEATRQTSFGELLGTLGYMSPEQMLGDPLEIDTRSDIYALGVVLYELLTGRLPYKVPSNFYEAARTIQEEEPALLSAADNRYKGDLETIVQKALAKDKTRRYSSTAELATDLRHYLNNEPILAKPPSASYQLKKFAVRHKGLVGAVAAVFVVLVTGIVATSLEAVRAARAERVAVSERDRALKEEQRADTQAATAKAVNDFLQNDLLAQAGASAQAQLAGKVDPDLKVRTALDRASTHIAGKFKSQPEVEASIRQTIGSSYRDLGLFPQAREQMQRALELRQRALDFDNADTLRSLDSLAQLDIDEGNYPQAETHFNQLMSHNRGAHSNGQFEADAMTGLSQVYSFRGDHLRAMGMLEKSLEIEKKLLGPKDPHVLSLADALSVEYINLGRFAQGIDLLTKALAQQRQTLGSEHPDTLDSIDNLGHDYRLHGDYAKAEPLVIEALDVRRRLLGENHPDTLDSLKNLGALYVLEHKYSLAEPLLKQAFEGNRAVLGQAHPDTLQTLSYLSDLYWKEGRFEQAETLLKAAIETERSHLGPNSQRAIADLRTLAAHDIERRKYAQAEAVIREVIETENRLPYQWSSDFSKAILGAALAGQGKFEEAEPLLRSSYRAIGALGESVPMQDPPVLERIRKWIIGMYQAWGKPDKVSEWPARTDTP